MALGLSQRSSLVLYGTETGNAQDIAEELGRLSERLLFSTKVLPLDAVEPEQLNTASLVLIAISTTGQGDLPGNSKRFWKKLLRKKLLGNHLSRTIYALFGLGDSSYPQYNWAALKLDKRLKQLGAIELVPRSGGDEQHPEGSDAAFLPWLQGLRIQVLEAFPLPEGQHSIPDDVLLQPAWLLSEVDESGRPFDSSEKSETISSNIESLSNSSAEHYLQVTVQQNDRVTSKEHFQDVRHLRLETQENITYMPSDILTIFPRNDPDDVQQLLEIMGWKDKADIPVRYIRNSAHHFYSSEETRGLGVRTSTLRNILTAELDFVAIPKRSFFSLLAHFTDDEFQKERLLEFANPEYVDELFDYTTRPRRSILEVLQEFDTVKVSWHWATVILPPLRGRQFSLASGGSLKASSFSSTQDKSLPRPTGTSFELLVAIVKYRTVIKKIRRGICTRYLQNLEVGAKLKVALQRGSLDSSQSDLTRPVMLVGPGTGVAPSRALIWERWAWQQAQEAQLTMTEGKESASRIAPVLLFFGCRNSSADYFFENEWTELQKSGMPLRVFTAFSRDQKGKVYVQDRIVEQRQLVFENLCQSDGLVFVCGSSGKMPQAVRGALLEVMQTCGNMEPKEAEQELKRMEKLGRYKQETW